MEKKKTNLGMGSVGKLLFSLALPAIIAQFVNVLYNIVDRMFIGRVPGGELAMAGVGVVFPVLMIVSAFSALIGMGAGPLAAIKMGKKDNDGAEKIMSNSFSSLIIIGILLTVVFFSFKEPILTAFGATPETITYATDYLGVYLFGIVFIQIALGMNAFITTQGFAKIAMATVMIGAVINIILDPIFIFGLNLGVKGAALATVIAQLLSAIWVLKFLFGKKSILRIRKEYLMPEPKVMLGVLALGIAPFIMQGTESLVIITMNNQLLKYGGNLAIGAMTIMSSIMQIIILPIVGLAQGAQPIISYNYGAKKIERVKKCFKLLVVVSVTYTTLMWGLTMSIPEMFVKLFNNNPELLEITSWSMRIFFLGIFIFGVQMACQQALLALGQAKISLILALLRKMVLLVPLTLILPNFFENKLLGVLAAEPVSDLIAALTTMICFAVFYNKILSKESEKEEMGEIGERMEVVAVK